MACSFEDLDVWKKSCRLAVQIYGLLENCRDYGIRDQMLRASVSIPSNIAEGSERNTIPEFKRFINIAKASAAELRTQVYITGKVGILRGEDAKDVVHQLKSISKMLQALHDALENRQQ